MSNNIYFPEVTLIFFFSFWPQSRPIHFTSDIRSRENRISFIFLPGLVEMGLFCCCYYACPPSQNRMCFACMCLCVLFINSSRHVREIQSASLSQLIFFKKRKTSFILDSLLMMRLKFQQRFSPATILE